MTENNFITLIPSRADELPGIIKKLEITAEEVGFGEKEICHLTSSLYEALTNALEHGNGGDENKKIEVEIRQKGSRIDVRIKDEGEGFRPLDLKDPRDEDGLFAARGRGIFIMKRFMDSVCYNKMGNEITISLSSKDG